MAIESAMAAYRRQDERIAMRKLILSALLLTAVPAFAQEVPRDATYQNRDGDRRDGDRREYRDHDRRDYRDDRRDYRDGERRGYAQGYREGERREWRDDRRDFRAGDGYGRWRAQPFYYPRGYGYRYYAPGAFLPRIFFGGTYGIGNPAYYQLPPAYGGTRWTRVGPDALLIRARDGYVVRVIRGIFY